MKRPLILFGTTTIIAICFFNLLGFSFTAAVFGVSIILFPILFFIKSKYKLAGYAFICVIALLVSCGSFCTKTVADYLPAIELCSDESQSVSGTVYKYEEAYGGHYYTLTNAKVNNIQTSATVRVYNSAYIPANIDDTISLSSAVIYELGASGGSTSNYKANNIYIGASNKGAITVTKADKHSINYYLNCIRTYVSDSLALMRNKDFSAVAVALLTGNQSDIDGDVLNNFRYSGISHLFAVSGFHLTLWTSVINIIFSKAFKKKNQLPTVISIIFVIFFMALTGFTKSVTRAGIMMLIILAGKLLKRNSDALNSLFGAGALILIHNPYAVMSASLQLSFLSTFGIILLSKPVNEVAMSIDKKIKNEIASKTLKTVYTTLTISIVASLFTLPVSAISFGSFSLWAPITNILCLPAGQLMMMSSALASITSPVTAISKPLLVLTASLAKYILFITDKIARLNNAVADTSATIEKAIFTVIIIAIVLLILILRNNNKHIRAVVAISYICVMITAFTMIVIQADNTKITVADVGNGTSLVFNVKGNSIIIGCGGANYKDYKLTNAADVNNSMQYDLLILPRSTKTESAYANTIIKRYNFDGCICNSQDMQSFISEKLPENTYITDYCTLNLDENCNLVYINNDAFSGVRITTEDFSCTIIFYPMVDFSTVDESWQQGSLLITRQALPDIDLSGFENIILSSSADIEYDNSNIYSTAHSGQIIYKTYPFSSLSVTEANK